MMKYVMIEDRDPRRWGIAAIEGEHTIDTIADISTDREAVRQMADKLTRGEASILHFRDIIEDFVAQV